MAVFPIIAIVLSALLTRLITKSWLSPGSFYSASWSFFLIMPLIFTPEYKIDHLGLWFIAIFSMALASGSLISFSLSANNENPIANRSLQSNHKPLVYVFFLLSAIGLLGVFFLINYASNIYNYNYYTNNLLSIPNLIAVERYSGTLSYPIIIKYSLYFIYPATLLGGLLFGLREQLIKNKSFFMFPLLISIILGIVEGARTSILLGLILFISAWLSTLTFRSKSTTIKKSYIKIIFGAGVFSVFFITFFILIQWLRQGMDTIIVELLIERIRAYFFGYLSAFSQWLGTSAEFNQNLGLITFAGPFNLLGIMDRPLGFYNPIYIANGVSTNIFTAYRGLVSDFSIPGAIFIAFLIGFITQSIFQNADKFKLINTLPISMFYAFTLYSPLISIFHYNSILFSWIIISFPLIISHYGFLANNR